MQIVLYGTFHCTRELGRRLIERKQTGEILSIVTNYAQSGSAFVLPSAVAKAGVLAMMRSLAVEWATYGIRAQRRRARPLPHRGRLQPADAGLGDGEAGAAAHPVAALRRALGADATWSPT